MKSFFTGLLLLSGLYLQAQDFSFGKIKKEDFAINIDKIDTAANAFVLREYGSAEVSYNKNKGLVVEFFKHVRIKILNKEAYIYANFSIPLYKSGNEREVLMEIKGASYHLVGEKVVETEMTKANIFNENSSENYAVTKAAIPQVQEGTIIEYRYRTESPFIFNLNAWEFQEDLPKLYSQYVTRIPEICHYKANLKGAFGVSDRKVENYNTGLFSEVGEILGNKTVYTMENIPAFHTEDYMTSSKNFRSIIFFELGRYSVPMGPTKDFSLTWENVRDKLVQDESFGGQVKRKSALKDFMDPVLQDSKDDLEKAVRLYTYFQKQIKWNNRHSIYAKNIKEAIEKRTGNSADINLGLVNALRYAKLDAIPVILSTRDNGYAGLYAPAISEFNHVIAQVKIGENYYLLDATSPYEMFGNIPMKCVNYQGRSIPLEGESDWVKLEANLSSSYSNFFYGELSEDGALKGKWITSRNGYGASKMRERLQGSNSEEEFYEKIDEENNRIKINSFKVSNRESLDKPLTEEFEIEIKNFATLQNDQLLFNPYIDTKMSKNPFNLTERNYPIDFGSLVQEECYIEIKLPKGYAYPTEGKLKNISMALPERAARYIFKINNTTPDVLIIESATQLNKPLFMPEEYFDLKEFFSRIIQAEKLDVVLKKI
ncbi:transglutaminase domain-containing protein [Sphingobacterium sp. 18053]|uniref:transglutaminase domain-containing protein n=1 Tax=Sphingobacterium sp. 18053 TaxID=2681401 RepID=UPI00135B31A3|nr:transglutaminase domain-containing protein [Sphingobacterium sp. 18053]